MKRRFLILLSAALLLPILVLAAMVIQAERATRDAQVFRVPIHGVDPRDILKGHYFNFDYDWDWLEPPSIPGGERSAEVTICLTAPRDQAKGPLVSLQIDDCLARIDGELNNFNRPVFRPKRNDSHHLPRLYVPEDYALRLEGIARSREVPLTVDIAVTADRRVLIRGWHVNGELAKDYFR